MEEIKIGDKTFVSFVTSGEIDRAVQRMTNTIYEEYQDKTPVFIGVLNGVILFFSDFLKHYKGSCEIGFLQLSSYRDIQSTGQVKITQELNIDITGRDVIILEDIIDTGNTLEFLHDLLETQPVNSIKIVTLFFKPEVYKKDLNIDLIGMDIPNKFVVGYGLDYNGLGRNLKDLYQLKED